MESMRRHWNSLLRAPPKWKALLLGQAVVTLFIVKQRYDTMEKRRLHLEAHPELKVDSGGKRPIWEAVLPFTRKDVEKEYRDRQVSEEEVKWKMRQTRGVGRMRHQGMAKEGMAKEGMAKEGIPKDVQDDKL